MRQTRKSSLFLLELIIAILFFALAAAVCVRLFGVSYTLTKQSEYRNTAVLQAQSIAEIYRNDDGNVDSIVAWTGATMTADGVYICYLDADGNFSGDNSESSYEVIMTVTADALAQLTVEILPPYEDNDAIFTLSTAIYLQEEVGA